MHHRNGGASRGSASHALSTTECGKETSEDAHDQRRITKPKAFMISFSQPNKYVHKTPNRSPNQKKKTPLRPSPSAQPTQLVVCSPFNPGHRSRSLQLHPAGAYSKIAARLFPNVLTYLSGSIPFCLQRLAPQIRHRSQYSQASESEAMTVTASRWDSGQYP
jgi:hypothetical protein